jgi:hypothetical protein
MHKSIAVISDVPAIYIFPRELGESAFRQGVRQIWT